MAQPVSTYPDLAGKVAAVAGGSGGIGAATHRLLAANGAKVAVNGRDEAKIGAVVDESRSEGGQAIGVGADVTDFAAIERMRRRVEEELGPVNVLATFAASGPPPRTGQALGDGRLGTPRGLTMWASGPKGTPRTRPPRPDSPTVR